LARDGVACVSHKTEKTLSVGNFYRKTHERFFSNLSCRVTWIKRKVLFSDVRSPNNMKALDLEGDEFRLVGAFVHSRVPAEGASSKSNGQMERKVLVYGGQ